MKKFIFATFVVVFFVIGASCSISNTAGMDHAYVGTPEPTAPPTDLEIPIVFISAETSLPDAYEPIQTSDIVPEEIAEPWYSSITEIELLALITMAEAEGECEEGQRLVIDTVLNRVDHPHYPDNIHDVIWQKNQFSSLWDGRIDRCYVMDELVELVLEELENRTNYDVMFFRGGRYHSYGVPMFQVGAHYFSSYE